VETRVGVRQMIVKELHLKISHGVVLLFAKHGQVVIKVGAMILIAKELLLKINLGVALHSVKQLQVVIKVGAIKKLSIQFLGCIFLINIIK